MIEPLLDSNERGVSALSPGGELKRTPSSVYWAGLGTWGIRTFEGSQADYFRAATALSLKQGIRRRKQDGTPTQTQHHSHGTQVSQTRPRTFQHRR